jgi:hypothetical protein
MSDLVERVRALNPVATCSPPSIDDVWRKLEREETPQADDAAHSTLAGVDRRRGAAPRRRARPSLSRLGLVAAVAIPVLVAAVALIALHHHDPAAQTPGSAHHAAVQSPSQRLVDGTISCYFASSGPLHPVLHPVGNGADQAGPATGQSPIAYCRRAYSLNAHTGIKAARVQFVACQSSPTNVAVYVADGRSGQCQRLGHRPLPASYRAALTQVQTLERDLTELQQRQSCTSVHALATQVNSQLLALGFVGWHVVVPQTHLTPEQLNSPEGTGTGPCGSLIAMPADNSPKSSVPIQPHRHVVYIQGALPRRTDIFVYQTQSSLIQRTYNHCFTPTTVRQLTTRAFARADLRTRYATTATPLGEGFEPASQKLYDRGCVRVNSVYPSNNGRYIDVWLLSHSAPTPPRKQLFPLAEAFQP